MSTKVNRVENDYKSKIKNVNTDDKVNKNISFGKRHKRFSPHNIKQNDGKFEQTHKKKKPFEFPYGNYHRYYGFRNAGEPDPRMTCLKKEWFAGKDVLDIGCNAGHFTLAIASYFSPKTVIGVDIDPELILMANKNVRHYLTDQHIKETDFPQSLVLNSGPIAIGMDPRGKFPPGNFPFNIQFLEGNYILPYDYLLSEQEAFFDTVLCLSVTKWIHLNWGDDGIRRLFIRIFRHLRPGGRLILEAQLYESYSRKKKITEESFHHYKSIKLFPEMFNEYLLKEVGFETCDLIDTPAHSSQGFSRPMYLFTKKASLNDDKPKHIIYDESAENQASVPNIKTEQL